MGYMGGVESLSLHAQAARELQGVGRSATTASTIAVNASGETVSRSPAVSRTGGSDLSNSDYSGPWVKDAKNVTRNTTVLCQSHPDSCVSAAGHILTGGRVTEQELLSQIGRGANADKLVDALNHSMGTTKWRGGGLEADQALLVAQHGPMAAELRVPHRSMGHMVVIEPIGSGTFRVLDPWGGMSYEVTAAWIRQYVSAGVFR